MRLKLLAVVAGVAVALGLALPAGARDGARSGKAVYESTCASCHAKGVQGAPKVGDKKAWGARMARGLSGLTQSAIKGVRGMPAHGGSPDLSDLEIGRAITYMVNRSGGRWVEPARLEDVAAERSGAQIVGAHCAECHRKGVGGAPPIGDLKAWTPRLKDGLDNAVRTAARGHGGMPPRGGQAALTDSELRNAVLYMINPAKPAAKGAPAAPLAGLQKTVGGIQVQVGLVPAATLRVFPEGSTERSMHGGVPSGSGYYHVTVALADASAHTPIEGATVEIRAEKPGASGVSVTLEPLRINDVPSYGQYVRLPVKGTYRITVKAQKPGAPLPVEAVFSYRVS